MLVEPASPDPRTLPRVFDVVICGAGLTLARPLRRELPQLSLAMLERTSRPLPDQRHMP